MAKIIRDLNAFFITHEKHSRIVNAETEYDNVVLARESVAIAHESTRCSKNITHVNHESARLIW